jgi:hypothetical protein
MRDNPKAETAAIRQRREILALHFNAKNAEKEGTQRIFNREIREIRERGEGMDRTKYVGRRT